MEKSIEKGPVFNVCLVITSFFVRYLFCCAESCFISLNISFFPLVFVLGFRVLYIAAVFFAIATVVPPSVLLSVRLCERCPYLEFFPSVFSRIRPEYGPENLGIWTLFIRCNTFIFSLIVLCIHFCFTISYFSQFNFITPIISDSS